MSRSTSILVLKVVLLLAGLAIMFTGINVGFGGIQTLGWQGESGFTQPIDVERFQAQDSHVRFLGGLWLAVGGLFLVSAGNPAKFRMVLQFAMIAIFIGGLARFSQLDLSVTLGPNIIGSAIAELVGMPLLCYWLGKVTLSERG